MRKMTKMNLRERSQKILASLEAPDDEGITMGGKRVDQWPTFHYFAAEDDEGERASGGLNHLVQRNSGGAEWTWKKVTVVVDSRAAENVNTEEHVSRNIHRGNGKIQEREGFKGLGGGHIKNHGQQVMSVRTLEEVVRKSTLQVADVKTPCVGTSHHPSRKRLVHREE